LRTSGTEKESGYSLVEVLAAIVILTVAIIPMVGMFDAALRAVSTSGDYGVARACAGQKLEQVRSLPYETVSGGLPGGSCEPSRFSYAFHEEFVNAELQEIQGDQGLTRVTVTVSWDGGDSYAATGVVSRW
jgi:prepilin-type N-terminal cleavage/methylation domain-containing protein